MQFYESTNKTGIVDAALNYASVTLAAYPIEDLTRNINRYYKRAVTLIQQVDKQWQWDDTNRTDLPVETTNVVSGQADYTLNGDVREILRIQILDNDGEPRALQRLPNSDDRSLGERFPTTGIPLYFENVGESLILYPTPSYSSSAALKIWDKRSAELFVDTDTTKEPGFSSGFHDYLALGAGYEYLRSKKPNEPITSGLYNDMKEMERDIMRFYSRRSGVQSLSVAKSNDQ